MLRSFSLLTLAAVSLAACVETTQQLGSDGKPLPQLYRIRAGETSAIQFRMLDSVNALRQAAGATPVQMNAQLNAAAATHARDMAIQNRPWHFGSDGSSPLDRVARVGYTGALVGENISETYETEIETLAAWMEQPDTRRVVVAPEASDLGFAWHQEVNGKIWWTLVMGDSSATQVLSAPIPDADTSPPQG
ncbi:MAG: CAP domain-containing protein [Pseudomonadota bacterium]|uniref:CAP domain-containing protein n=1 Tax=Thalassovita sp. TaxID=1979401 RepID=UPI002AB0C70B|nr:CAP domain-containing protein [Thalassovita sp.]MEC7962561.1 CAP domain-containing protein [Pseudomonadota bacterium]MEC8041206.1 CAP domain-containing protein [Pseudomonadota bacterium]MEC8293812.1 CAP domain-containing protein [Pseudomonadota bacterium]